MKGLDDGRSSSVRSKVGSLPIRVGLYMTLYRGAEYEQTPESGPSKPNQTKSLMPSEYTK